MNSINKFIKNIPFLKQGLCVCLFAAAVNLYAQEDSVSVAPRPTIDQNLSSVAGRVTDAATRKPIVGARVRTLDGRYSAMTDENGLFNLRLSNLRATVEVVADDYALREIPLRSEKSVDVQLYSSAFEDLFGTVETLQGKRRKSSVTSPVVQMQSMSNSGIISLDEEIASKLGGEMRAISHSAVPGNGASMFIRGINSINAMTQPLILVDGVVFDNQNTRSSILQGFFFNPLSSIDVNDIADVTILKDGTALYGSKGANGVIMITTKRGESQATRIQFSAFMGINESPKLPDMMNSDQFRRYASEVVKGQGLSDNSKIVWLNDDPARSYYKTYHNETDWTDEVYRTSVTQGYNVAVNGGDESALYNLSVGFVSAPSTLKNSSYNRLNARFNSDIKLYSRLSMAMDISYSQTDREAPSDGIPSDYTEDPVTSLGFLALAKSPFLSPMQYTTSGNLSSKYSLADVFGVSNPTALVDDETGEISKNENNHMNIAVTPKYAITKDLLLSSLFSYTLDKVVGAYFRPDKGTPDFDRGSSFDANNTVKTFASKLTSVFSDTRLNWNKSFTDHHINALLGYRYISDTYTADWARADNTGNDRINTISAGMKNRTADGVYDDVKSAAIYANVDYNWLNKYFLSGAMSFDTSSRFGSKVDGAVHIGDYSWGLFPSIQGAWIISSEDFMKSADFLNLWKIRAGYTVAGNDQFQSFGSVTYFSPFQYFNNLSGLQLAQLGNETLGWETSHKFNVGMDVSLFKDIVSVSVDVYKNRISDLLTLSELPAVSGQEYYWLNSGKMDNKGVEASIRIRALDLRTFKWELGASIAHYKNKVISLYDDAPITTSYYGAEFRTQVGSAAGLFYGYQTNGVYATTEETVINQETGERLAIIDNTGKKTYFEGGDMRFVDQNGDGIIDENDKVIIGDANPDFTGTLSSRMKWKQFTFDALFTFSKGNDVYNYLRSQLESGATFYNQTLAMTRAWTHEGQVTDMPRIAYGDPMGNARFSDRWIEDGSYFRLKTLSLSYDIPLKSSFVQGLTVWASAHNLFTLTKYLGSDPEFSSSNYVLFQGVDAGLLGHGRSYYLGVKVNL